MSTPTLDRPVPDAPTASVRTPAGASPAPPSLGPTPDARLAAVVAVLALAAGLLSLLGGPLVTTTEFASLVDGPLEVRDPDGWRALAVGDRVGDGARLRAVGAAVTLEVEGGRIALASGARGAVDDGRLVIERGSVLVDAVTERTVVAGGVRAVGTGAWRVDAGTQPRVATYAGSLVARDGDTEVRLAAYRQLTVRDRTLGGATALPLRYLASDAFDREQVDEALRIDELAHALGRSLARTHGEAPRGAAFYTTFGAVDGDVETHLAELAPVARAGRYGPPAEVLIGVAVAAAVADVTGEPAADATASTASLRGRGAEWGLVVVAAGGDTEAFNAAVDRALEEAADEPPPAPGDGALDLPGGAERADAARPGVTPPPGPDGAGGRATDEGEVAGGGSAGGGGAGGGTAGGGGRPDAPRDAPGSRRPSPPTPDPGGVLAPVEEALRDLGRQVGGPVRDVTGTVGDVVGGLDESLDASVRDLLGG